MNEDANEDPTNDAIRAKVEMRAEGPAAAARTAKDLERLRPLLFSIAYRMVGESGDAEDIVQEAFLRAHRTTAAGTPIANPKAFLAEVTTRLAIDHLRSARVRRERYVGPWLPEPLLDPEPDVGERVALDESLSLAFLVLLESLSPVERAVFLLHDIFGFEFDEIARTVEKSADNCRQIAVRARRSIEARRPRFDSSPERRNELAARFFAATQAGDVRGLIDLLAEDVVVVADGGGHGALRVPARGALRVARFLAGLARQAARRGYVFVPATVNAEPGAIAYDPGGQAVTAMAVHVEGGRVTAIHSVVNPEKLRNIPPLGFSHPRSEPRT
jgi:RNA polymerase sigma-70 factor (TIGR02957 family)